jgi:hypothetical protein
LKAEFYNSVIYLKQLAEARSQKADAAARKIASFILPLKQKGIPLREICTALNSAGVKTERGGDFHPSLVSRMLRSLEKQNEPSPQLP